MKKKTSELIDWELDCAVAKCEGFEYDSKSGLLYKHKEPHFFKRYSTDWSQGGQIIDREGISLKKNQASLYPKKHLWVGISEDLKMEVGPTPLIAAMRCYVASKLGDEVEILNVD